MSKYCLVASYYDMYNKKFSNETVIELPDIKLDSLLSIDEFTTSHTYTEIMNLIKGYYGDNFSNIAIKYYKNKNANPIYYKAIIDNDTLLSCIKETSYGSYRVFDKKISAPLINLNNSFLTKERNDLWDIIITGDTAKFTDIYPNNNLLSTLVMGYMTSDFDEINEKYRMERLINREFSRYKTFRGWIVNKDKLSQRKDYNNSKKEVENNIATKSNTNSSNHSILEYENEYERIFENTYGISYSSYLKDIHNELNDEKEEFIDEDELIIMYGKDNSPLNHTRRK